MFGEHLGDGVVTTHPSTSKRKRRGGQPGTGRKLRRAGPSGEEEAERPTKHQEPHGWQHGATDVQGRRGVSRQGGGKPWRRNEDRQWFCPSRSSGSVPSVAGNRSGSGLFGSERRRGDLWNPRRGIRRWPQATVGGRDGSVGKGDVEVQEGTGQSFESVMTHPVRGPWAGVRGDPREPGTGGSKVRRAATFIGLVS